MTVSSTDSAGRVSNVPVRFHKLMLAHLHRQKKESRTRSSTPSSEGFP